MKVNRQNVPVVLVITLCKVALTFASVHEIAVNSIQSRKLGGVNGKRSVDSI